MIKFQNVIILTFKLCGHINICLHGFFYHLNYTTEEHEKL